MKNHRYENSTDSKPLQHPCVTFRLSLLPGALDELSSGANSVEILDSQKVKRHTGVSSDP
jgi:hypothetical protein